MKKGYFWPIAMIVMGLIFLANQVGLLPRDYWNLWPIILIVVGLGGLLTADREEWMVDTDSIKNPKKPTKTKTKAKKTTSSKK